MLNKLVSIFILLGVSPASVAFASYSNLLTTADGSAVWFSARTSLSGTAVYKLTFDQNRAVITPAGTSLDDLSDDGRIAATTSYAERYCGFAGSTCFLAPTCRADFTITGPATDVTQLGHRSIVRLNRAGTRAWVEQSTVCGSPVERNPPEFQGLYSLPAFTAVKARDGKLANYRSGRQMITTADRVLTFGGPLGIQLQLVDATGVRQVRHVYGAAEAVIDAAGQNIVYVDAPVGHLHWIDLADQSEDDLGLPAVLASAPAISDNGNTLAFLSESGVLNVYRRSSRTVTALDIGRDRVSEFILAGNGKFIFAATSSGRLLRVDVATGTAQTWLEPFPEIEDASAAKPDHCPLICYPAPPSFLIASPLSLVVFRGSNLDLPGWRVQIADRDWPLQPLSSNAAWFQTPADLQLRTGQTLTIVNPAHPLQFSARFDGGSQVVSCFGALHMNFGSIVTSDNPAAIGEALHVFMTGLTGTQPVAPGVPNPLDRLIRIASPPAFNAEGGFQSLFFGLAPGLIGIQQLDIVIRQATFGGSLFDGSVQEIGCTIPPVAR